MRFVLIFLEDDDCWSEGGVVQDRHTKEKSDLDLGAVCPSH